MKKECSISELLGKTLVSIENKDNKYLEFKTTDGETFAMFDENSSFGNDSGAELEDISGFLNDLLNHPILVAEERSSDAPSLKKENGEDDDWYTTIWTFYELATIKGSVTLRWYCVASPYYAAKINFLKV